MAHVSCTCELSTWRLDISKTKKYDFHSFIPQLEYQAFKFWIAYHLSIFPFGKWSQYVGLFDSETA